MTRTSALTFNPVLFPIKYLLGGHPTKLEAFTLVPCVKGSMVAEESHLLSLFGKDSCIDPHVAIVHQITEAKGSYGLLRHFFNGQA